MNFVKQNLLLFILMIICLINQNSSVLYANTQSQKSHIATINKDNIPTHIAIIMDGNGRWGIQKGKNRNYGHQSAIKNVKEVIKECIKLKVKYLTFYGFSTENWKRDKNEVDFILELIASTIEKEINDLVKNNIKVTFIGDLQKLPLRCINAIESISKKSSKNNGLQLIIAICYSSKWEIMKAIQKIIIDSKKGIITEQQVNENFINEYLETKGIPDPDLLIRTSGENRLSNFLLHQIAYTELYFTSTLWPDFEVKDLHEAIIDYQSRDRRFGGINTKRI